MCGQEGCVRVGMSRSTNRGLVLLKHREEAGRKRKLDYVYES